MAEKYHCPTCGRRYVDWGAKNLDFKCPTDGCMQATLILMNSENSLNVQKPKTKRTAKNKTIVPITNPEDALVDHDLDIDGDSVIADDSDDLPDDEEDEPVKLEKE